METAFFIHLKKKFVRINLDEINYILSVGHHIKIHTVKGVYVPHLSLKQLENILPSNSFSRVNRATIICIDKITAFTRDEVFLNADSFFITDKYRDELRDKLLVLVHTEKDDDTTMQD